MEIVQGLVLVADAALVAVDVAFGFAHRSSPVFVASGLPAMVLVGASLGFVRAGRAWYWALGLGLALAAQLHTRGSESSLLALAGSLLLCGFAALVGSGARHLWDSRNVGGERRRAAGPFEESDR